MLEYHHPEALPTESAFLVRVASILQVRPSSSGQRLDRQQCACMHAPVLPWPSPRLGAGRQPSKLHHRMQGQYSERP